MANSKVGSVWVNPLSTNPTDLINRAPERKKLLGKLEEYLETDIRDARILVTGDRGVGKSILTHAVLEEFAKGHPDDVRVIVVKGRGVEYKGFLKAFALDLAQALRPLADRWSKRDLRRWLDELTELTQSAQIVRSHADSSARRYGVGAEAGVDLYAKLTAKFTWEETRSLGTTKQLTLTVTDDVLHDAITHTLERLRTAKDPVTVVVFYDDLDQAFGGEAKEIESGMQRVLELQPCIAVAHIRSEALSENVGRVITDEVMVGPLSSDDLIEVLRKRVTAAKPEAVRTAFGDPSVYGPFMRLAKITGNALAFLRWCKAILSLWDVEVPTDWTSEKNLRSIALEATPHGGIDARIIIELAQLIDACAHKDHNDGCRLEDLKRGALASVLTPPRPSPLSENELTQLMNLGLLIKRNQFVEQPVFRVAPTLELLRPSVAEKLRQTT